MWKVLIASLLLLLLAKSAIGFSPSTSSSSAAARSQSQCHTRLAVLKDNTVLDVSSQVPRRQFFASALIGAAIGAAPQIVQARWVLDDETGDYVEAEDEDWQTAWKQRLDKAQSMSTDDVFKAARGAGNLDLKQGTESDASKKRRAMSGCRDADLRQKANAGSERECTARVFSGDFEFMMNQL